MNALFKNKKVLLVAGLLVGLVTLFSHSLRVEIKSGKAATGQKAETEQQTVIVAPSDAITVNTFTLQVDGFLEIAPVFKPVKQIVLAVPVICGKVAPIFHTLFRFIIAPNAP